MNAQFVLNVLETDSDDSDVDYVGNPKTKNQNFLGKLYSLCIVIMYKETQGVLVININLI